MQTATHIPVRLPPFGKFTEKLNEAGVVTGTGRQFWGGVNDKGEIIVTAWIDQMRSDGRFPIWRPKTNHGGLLDQWRIGNIRNGADVRLILLRQRGNLPEGVGTRQVGMAALMPGKWRVVEVLAGDGPHAFIEASPNT